MRPFKGESKLNNSNITRTFLVFSTILILILTACGEGSTNASSVVVRTPTHETTKSAAPNGISCPNPPKVSKVSKVVANFEGTSDQIGPEEGYANAQPSKDKACAGTYSLKVQTSMASASQRHTVLLTAQFAPTDMTGMMFGCYTFFPNSIATDASLAYYVRPMAASVGFVNDFSGDFAGTEVLDTENTGRWVFSFVNIGQLSVDGPSFDPKNVIALGIGVYGKPGGPAFSGTFYVDYCILSKSWHALPSNPTSM